MCFLNGPFPASYYFRLFNTVDRKQMFNIYFLPMTGFELRTALPTESQSLC